MSMRNNKRQPQLTGEQIRKAMRARRVTIAGVAAHMGITQKRVREVRARGVAGLGYVRDWAQGIFEAREAVTHA